MKPAALIALLAVSASPLVAQKREAIGQSSPTLTPAIRVGNMVYASGQLGNTSDTTIAGQTRTALERTKAVFEQAGAKMENAVKCTVFLTDVRDFRAMNTAYSAFWASNPPARSTVVVAALVVPTAKIEIECIAAIVS